MRVTIDEIYNYGTPSYKHVIELDYLVCDGRKFDHNPN